MLNLETSAFVSAKSGLGAMACVRGKKICFSLGKKEEEVGLSGG